MADKFEVPESPKEQISRIANHCETKALKGSEKFYQCMRSQQPVRQAEMNVWDPDSESLWHKLKTVWKNRAYDRTGAQTIHKGTKVILDEILPVEEVEEGWHKGKEAIAAAKKGDMGGTLMGAGGVIFAGGKAAIPKPIKKASKSIDDGLKVNKNKKKKKENLKCGEGGTYYDLKKKIAQAVGMERDYVPSSAALKKRAFELNGGEKLSDTQLRKIENVGHTLAIPKGIHMDFSLTYKSLNNKDLIAQDASDLRKAAKRDMEAIKKGLDPECKKRYKEYAKKIEKLTNDDYDKMLAKALKGK